MAANKQLYYAEDISCTGDFDKKPHKAYSHYLQPFIILPNTNLPYSDIQSQESIFTLSACMDYCSTVATCAAFSWNNDCTCWTKTSDAVGGNVTQELSYSGYTPSEVIIPPDGTLPCPYENLSVQNASNGASFKVMCGTDFLYSDFPSDYISSMPNYKSFDPAYTAWHTDTYDECLEMCATSHPLCYTFVFAAGPNHQWNNCFLKNMAGQTPTGFSDSHIHGGVLQMSERKTMSKVQCKNDAIRTITNSQGRAVDFKLSCNDFRGPTSGSEGIIASRHKSSIEDCLIACADSQGSSAGDKCIAAMFDEGLEYGFANCYLKSHIGNGTLAQNYTLAYLPSAAGQYAPPSKSSSSANSDNKGIIAGSVIGAVAFILILIVVGWLAWKKGWKPGLRRTKTLYRPIGSDQMQIPLVQLHEPSTGDVSSIDTRSARSRTSYLPESTPSAEIERENYFDLPSFQGQIQDQTH